MADINVEEVLSKLSIGEKVDLLAGRDFWHTKALPKHGVPSLRFSDGPNGLRGTKFFNSTKSACFPCGTGLGSTFNLPLLREAGVKMGEEAKLKGAHCILGPTINIQRSPLGGRGFESLSEDPFLSGFSAAALIEGIQSTGVQASLKHFICNDQEHKRNATQSIVTQRALREIYMLPFQLAIKKAAPGSIMTAYNGVNGTYCSENHELLAGILRGEWGWNGLVVSDWFGTYSTTQAALAGLDLEMPGPPQFRGEILKFNVTTDKVREHILDERARQVLRFVKKCAASGVKENAEERTGDTPETAELLRRLGGESLVLLKNECDVLPLKKDKKTVVIGPNAKIATYHGGGSASLDAYYAVSPFDGISAKLSSPPEYTVGSHSHKLLPLLGHFVTAGNGTKGMRMRVYNEPPSDPNRQCTDEYIFEKTDSLLIDYYNPRLKSLTWYADFEGSFIADEDCEWDLGLTVCGTGMLFVNGELLIDNATTQRDSHGDAFFGAATVEEKGRLKCKKGQNYTVKVEFGSAATSKLEAQTMLFGGGSFRIGGCKVIDSAAEIRRAAQLARDADQVIVCAGLNADWETEGADREGMDLPSPMDDLITAVAEANPKGTVVVMQSGTPVHMPWVDKVPSIVQAWYGGNETGNVIADILFGDVNPSGKLPLSFPRRLADNPAFLNHRTEGGRILYGEDVYVGYRYYEHAQRDVLFPFGHGLSYTTFAFSGLRVAENDGILRVEVNVKNTGDREGAEVVQVYVAPKQAKVNRPIKELKGFCKVQLGAGETKKVTVEVGTKYAAAYWDEERSKFCVEKGEFEVLVSNSSEIKEGKALRGVFAVRETFWWTGL
ncbi:hypothetical protein CEP54_014556 [Fusarium duplospermum]|uniref:beta-glucosidase n=1 Tax=Fusarium duplospermum TaxID=1325734 RepID=A0A428NVI2_9HYPO|nr:hypothetical protein CEP54_014556 [Fusarium duplospermum]